MKQNKILALALDPAAAEGEWRNAAVMWIKALRDQGIRTEQVSVSGGNGSAPPNPSPVVDIWEMMRKAAEMEEVDRQRAEQRAGRAQRRTDPIRRPEWGPMPGPWDKYRYSSPPEPEIQVDRKEILLHGIDRKRGVAIGLLNIGCYFDHFSQRWFASSEAMAQKAMEMHEKFA